MDEFAFIIKQDYEFLYSFNIQVKDDSSHLHETELVRNLNIFLVINRSTARFWKSEGRFTIAKWTGVPKCQTSHQRAYNFSSHRIGYLNSFLKNRLLSDWEAFPLHVLEIMNFNPVV